jgi:glutathionylspermidine synthase
VTALSPYRCGARLSAPSFARLRRTLVLEHCKWDPQVGDVAALADFPLVMPRATWLQLARWAEALTAEADAAERELLARPELHARLALPRRVRQVLAEQSAPAAPRSPRAYRYDFHFTDQGWRISECNADVPGGYAEGSAFTALMAEHYPDTVVAGDPGGSWARAIASAAEGRDVALLSAPGFMEDHQVVHYLAQRLRALGISAHCLQPSQVEWSGGAAHARGRQLGALVRFYQSEWLAGLPRESEWWRYFQGSATPVLNPGSCATIESKRFPLVWDSLRTQLPTWQELLPPSVDPRRAPWRSDDAWLLKTAFCNTGDTVSGRSLVSPRAWAKAARSARWFPGGWVAQRRFDAVSLQTPLGAVWPCIGVYTVEGRAAGAYARLGRGPVVDFAAVDVPLLIEEVPSVAHA